MTRDEIVAALRVHRAEIVEADEWRPLADHVLELVRLGRIALQGELDGTHIYQGMCPEVVIWPGQKPGDRKGSGDRDPHCPQCRRLVAAGFGVFKPCEPDCQAELSQPLEQHGEQHPRTGPATGDAVARRVAEPVEDPGDRRADDGSHRGQLGVGGHDGRGRGLPDACCDGSGGRRA